MYQVVCVDDESFVLEDLKRSIDWFGFNMEIVLATTDPLEALSYIKTHPVHLLLTDISMPQMMGSELIHKAKKINPFLSVLVLSAYDTFSYVRSAMQGGAENYLLKPLDPDELTESISIIVQHLDDRRKISDNYGPSILTFRSAFIENWCKGTLSIDDFLTRAAMLGINLELDNYTVVMFTTDAQYSSQMPSLFDALLSLFVGKYICHFYFENPQCFVSILSRTDSFNVFQFQSEMNKFRAIIDFPFSVFVGNTVTSYDEVSNSYFLIKKYSSLRFSPLFFFLCQNFQFPMRHQQLIERNFLEISVEDYMKDIQEILFDVTAERRISLQLSVVSWGISLITPTPSTADVIPLFQNIVCDKSDLSGILQYLQYFVQTIRSILEQHAIQQGMEHPYVKMIMDAVHDFTNKEISLKTLAAQFNMHPSYLGFIFHQQTDFYFNDYLNEERLKYAASLMECSDVKLKDVADMAGFSSQTYFNRQFKKKYGLSPNAYRRELKIKKGISN